MCKACNSRHKCKDNCNSHNNGGTCATCEPHDESDDNATDEEQAPETLPLVSRIADTMTLVQTVIVTMLLIHSYVYRTSQMIIVDWPDVGYDAE